MIRRFVALFVLGVAGCQQQMAHQPAYRPLEPSSLFPDRRSARPLVRGTVPWGEENLRLGPYYTGRVSAGTAAAAQAAALIANPNPAAGVATGEAPYLDAVPSAPEDLGKNLRRGQQRFNIYCAPCHDRAGTGRGMIVERGFTAPPSFHTDLSRGHLIKGQKIPLTKVPVGYIFEVISDGYGAMPSYAKQVPPDDRWAIVSYVRALQISQEATLADVHDAEARQQLLQKRGKE